jgi:hypothetical protein
MMTPDSVWVGVMKNSRCAARDTNWATLTVLADGRETLLSFQPGPLTRGSGLRTSMV